MTGKRFVVFGLGFAIFLIGLGLLICSVFLLPLLVTILAYQITAIGVVLMFWWQEPQGKNLLQDKPSLIGMGICILILEILGPVVTTIMK